MASVKPPLYRLQGLRKSYAEGFELNLPMLEIPRSMVFALLGPNGAGKSTLLRVLHFLETAEQGAIQFEGQRVDFPPPLSLRRRIGMVFQKPVMLSGSVRRNIIYGMRLRNLVEPNRLDSLMKELDLMPLMASSAKTLSGGEAQRVAVARALASRPDVLLLDEPVANLDPYNIQLIEHIIKRAATQEGMSVILVTHDVFQVRRLADQVAFMVGGQIIETRRTNDFFERPQDPRTKAYLRGELVG